MEESSIRIGNLVNFRNLKGMNFAEAASQRRLRNKTEEEIGPGPYEVNGRIIIKGKRGSRTYLLVAGQRGEKSLSQIYFTIV